MVPNGPNSPLVVKKQPHEAKNQVLDVEKTVFLPFEKNSETLNMLMLHQMRLCLVLQTSGVRSKKKLLNAPRISGQVASWA